MILYGATLLKILRSPASRDRRQRHLAKQSRDVGTGPEHERPRSARRRTSHISPSLSPTHLGRPQVLTYSLRLLCPKLHVVRRQVYLRTYLEKEAAVWLYALAGFGTPSGACMHNFARLVNSLRTTSVHMLACRFAPSYASHAGVRVKFPRIPSSRWSACESPFRHFPCTRGI